MKLNHLPLLTVFIAFSAFADSQQAPMHTMNLDQSADLKPCQIGNLEPSPSSPPNNSDDPGTTDPHCWEINHTFNIDHSKNPDGTRSDYSDYALDMNYGVKPGLQAKMVIHYNSLSTNDPSALPNSNGNASAIGRIELGAKQQIYTNEQKQLVVALFPTVDFMSPGSSAVQKGLPDTGTNLTLPVLVSKKYGPVVLVSNAGVILSLSDPTKPAQALMSFGAGVNVTDTTTITGEVYRTSEMNLHNNVTTSVGVGVSTKITKNAVLYMSLGETVGATADGAAHVYALAGVKVLFGQGSDSKVLKLNFKRRYSDGMDEKPRYKSVYGKDITENY